MSDIKNIDNPPPTESTRSQRWGWLKNLPGKILRKDSPPSSIAADNTESALSIPEVPEVPVIEQMTNTEPILSENLAAPISDEVTTEKEEVKEEVLVAPRVLGIKSMIQRDLTEMATQVPEVENLGVLAIISTNETVGRGFFEAIQAKHPDGYLIGVGSGNVYSMLHVFEDGVIPKGMVLADINPIVVAIGRLLIQNLKNSTTTETFQSNFFGMSEEVFNQQLQKMIADEPNVALKNRWESIDAKTWHEEWKGLSPKESIKWENNRAYKYEGANIDVVGAMLEKFDVLKQLADEDNIVMTYADFTSPDFIIAVSRLPEFDTSANVIYFSNIVDHITKRGTQLEKADAMNVLKIYKYSTPPAIFIDTLGQGLNYFLRARNSLAKFTDNDFRYRGIQPLSQKPEGLLFADNINFNPNLK